MSTPTIRKRGGRFFTNITIRCDGVPNIEVPVYGDTKEEVLARLREVVSKLDTQFGSSGDSTVQGENKE